MVEYAPPDPLSASSDGPRDVAEDSSRFGMATGRVLLSLTRLLYPDASEDDPEVFRRVRILVAANVILFAVCIFFTLVMYIIDQYPLSSVLVMLLGSVFIMMNLILLRITRSSKLIGSLLLIEIIAIISYQAFTDYGLLDPPMMWSIVIPWLAALFIGPSFSFAFAGLIVAVVLCFYMLESMGYPFPRVSSQDVIIMFYVLVVSTLAIFTGFLGWLYEGHTLGTLRRSNRRLQIAHDALQDSNQRIVSILESITNGFFALDEKWQFTYLNHRAEQLLEKTKEELLGKSAWTLFSRTIGINTAAAIRNSVRRQTASTFEVHYLPLDRWFEVHAYPFSGGLSVYFTDITDRKHYEAQLVDAKERAEELARLKSSILTNMSHELRTPLAGILGFAGVLVQESEGDHQEFARLIEQSGHRLLNTLNAMMDLTQIDSGNLSPKIEAFDLREPIERVINTHLAKATERGLYLVHRQKLDEIAVQADIEFLERILSNLVDNAIKFTETGGVEIRVTCDEQEVFIDVIDTGVGISESFLPHVFEEFRQESLGLSRSHEGTGLGLAVTRRLVDALQARIEVESAKNRGTRFRVRLPRAAVDVPL